MTRVLVAIDPGFSVKSGGCAVAIFEHERLINARFERPEKVCLDNQCVGAAVVIWECPQCDSRSHAIAPALIALAAEGGTLAGMYAGANGCRAYATTPAKWKGSVPKPIHHARVWRELDGKERALLGGSATLDRIEAAKREGALERWAKPGAFYYGTWTGHNLLDAVALGLWRLKRIS